MAGATAQDVEDQVASYCREGWDEEELGEMPEDQDVMVDMYFSSDRALLEPELYEVTELDVVDAATRREA